MHDITLHQHPKRPQQLIKIPQRLLLRKLPLRLNPLLQRPLITKLIHKVVVVGRFKDLDETHDMGGVLNLGQGVDLVDGELLEFGTGAELLDLDDLDGDDLAGLLVVGFVDLAELTRTHCGL